MFQRKRFRHRSKSRGFQRHNGNGQVRVRSDSFTNGQRKNNFRSTQSAEKLFEKYTSLAKEAMSSGDKTLSENYLQHADHFMRVIDDKNKNKILNNTNDKITTENKNLSPDSVSSADGVSKENQNTEIKK
tara:strand:- start:1628 stop:2017 length:390 start_codon:yes stop_codon:yes gene_type:complete